MVLNQLGVRFLCLIPYLLLRKKAYSMIIQVEDQKLESDEVTEYEGRVAMHVGKQGGLKGFPHNYDAQNNDKRRLPKEERKKLKCLHCHENVHEPYECFKLHGYSD